VIKPVSFVAVAGLRRRALPWLLPAALWDSCGCPLHFPGIKKSREAPFSYPALPVAGGVWPIQPPAFGPGAYTPGPAAATD
jgi:hypothetical protein